MQETRAGSAATVEPAVAAAAAYRLRYRSCNAGGHDMLGRRHRVEAHISAQMRRYSNTNSPPWRKSMITLRFRAEGH